MGEVCSECGCDTENRDPMCECATCTFRDAERAETEVARDAGVRASVAEDDFLRKRRRLLGI